MATLYAGTSGFAYPAWKPGFYPAKTPANQFLKYYAQRLNCVEINYTFRRLPSASTLENWVAQTGAGFVFAVKANMRITHILRLKNAAEATGLFLKMIDPLRSARRLASGLQHPGRRPLFRPRPRAVGGGARRPGKGSRARWEDHAARASRYGRREPAPPARARTRS